MKNWGSILVFWSIVVFSCDPCNECGEPLLYEPTVAVTFVNQDSIASLDTIISKNEDTVLTYKSISQALEDQIDSLEKEIDRMNDSIQNGNTAYEDSLNLVIESLEETEEELLPVETKLDQLDSVIGIYTDIIRKINTGSLLVDKVTLNNGAEITYQDSMQVYNLPLLMEQTETSYQITIKEKTFSISLSYTLSETINDARVFRVIANDIVVDNYTCDSLIISCPNDICISNETNITAIY